ncbi:MAG TPA: glycolate oxidase subunit GlcF [Bauldia sp.]|nr:glycolate oxidase subunit GlcF [Bauldia sp.]
MQTNFTLVQLADPDTAVSEKILRSCVHCGFCTATCPTYVLLGDELDSPRGRIYLIKDMLENDKPANEKVALHIDRCLSCLACMTTCPSGVDYMHLVDHARVRINETYRRPWADRWVRDMLAAILPYPARFRAAVAAALVARPFLGLIRRLPGLSRLAPMISLAPSRLPRRSANKGKRVFAPEGRRKARVALLRGCAQSVLDPGINDAAIRLLTRTGVEVTFADGDGCCGALVHHMGRRHESHAQAIKAIDAWTKLIDDGGLDAILVTTSGCGTMIKDYGFMFRTNPDYAEKAARVSALAKDVSEYLETLDLGEPSAPPDLTVAYHAACSLQHGQQVKNTPKALLSRAGFDVVEPAEAHLCCGSAGTYNMLQPELSARLRERKVRNIEATGAGVVATGNIGCMTQIGQGTALPIVHTVELLDWAYGGPPPIRLTDRRRLHGNVIASSN